MNRLLHYQLMTYQIHLTLSNQGQETPAGSIGQINFDMLLVF